MVNFSVAPKYCKLRINSIFILREPNGITDPKLRVR